MNKTKFLALTSLSIIAMLVIVLLSHSLVEQFLAIFAWSFIHARLLFLRAQTLKDFDQDGLPLSISFWVGSIVPVLNLGIYFYYLTAEDR